MIRSYLPRYLTGKMANQKQTRQHFHLLLHRIFSSYNDL